MHQSNRSQVRLRGRELLLSTDTHPNVNSEPQR